MSARTFIRLALASSAAALIGTGALAQQPTGTTATATQARQDLAKDGVIVTGKSATDTSAPGKITDPKHPDFVRCRNEPVLNSRAARTRVCRTNREWTAAAREGNRRTEELLNAGRPTQPTP